MSQLTRGPLPAGVYWRRRLVVLLVPVVAVALVVTLARLLGGGSDGADPAVATRAAAGTSGAARDGAAGPTAGPTVPAGEKKRRKAAPAKPTPTRAQPTGRCASSDVKVLPVVEQAVAGRPVTVTMRLRTLLAAACTWELSRTTFTWKITSGSDEIWTSRQCPRGVPAQEIVLRRAEVTEVPLVWGGRRSDDECSRTTRWALPGWYHVTASALGGEPRDVQFELVLPTPATVTASPEPQPEDEQGEKKQRKKKRAGR